MFKKKWKAMTTTIELGCKTWRGVPRGKKREKGQN
jgi:hypothetical protein